MLTVVRGSVLDQDVDVIVNAANTAMRTGAGVNGAIHRAAGSGLLEELVRVAPNGCPTGQVVVTAGHNLRQRWIVHTPGPVWGGGARGEDGLLAACYRNAIQAASDLGAASVAFCSISTGIFGFPLERAAPIAVRVVREWLSTHPDARLADVRFAMYGEREFEAFRAALEATAPPSP